MAANIALIACVFLVALLLLIERRRNPWASLALWLPSAWMLIQASRPLGRWFRFTPLSSDPLIASVDTGSPIDRLILSMLIILALLVLIRRRIDWLEIASDNYWLFLLFIYLGVSILWSDIAFASFKRWFRLCGDIVMALVVFSERKPLQALESVFRRCAYILVPFSIVLIKYFPHWGRAYSRWSGMEMWTGVTMQKNSLGQLCALSAFLMIWSLIRDWRSKKLFSRKYYTMADAFILSISLFLLVGPSDYSRSATSTGILIIGTFIMMILYWGGSISNFVIRNLKILAVSSVVAYVLLYESVIRIATSILQRDETLTGRTDIWGPLIEFASNNPIFGVGYGGFWAPGNWELEDLFTSQFIIAQAHNGYLAIYVELGVIGLLMLAMFLLNYCSRIRNAIKLSFDWGVYGICLLPMALLYNNSEVCFLQSSSYLWSTIIFLTVAISSHCLTKEFRVTR